MMKTQRGSLLIYLLLGIALLGIVTGIVAAIHNNGIEVGRGECRAEAQKQAKKELEQSGEASTKLEVKNAATKVIYKTITKSVDKYIDRPTYRNPCLDADGLRDANAALTGTATPPSEHDQPVPRSDPAKQRNWWRGIAQAD